MQEFWRSEQQLTLSIECDKFEMYQTRIVQCNREMFSSMYVPLPIHGVHSSRLHPLLSKVSFLASKSSYPKAASVYL
ncbi:hypothetical protein Plhal304r1_c001g0003941 [Plasmopara halstedii]